MSTDILTDTAGLNNVEAPEKAVLYARVSSDDKGGDNCYDLLNGQLDICREHAIKQGYEILLEMPENAIEISGDETKLLFQSAAKQLASVGAYDVLVVQDPNKLSCDVEKRRSVEKQLMQLNVRVETAQ